MAKGFTQFSMEGDLDAGLSLYVVVGGKLLCMIYIIYLLFMIYVTICRICCV